MSIIELKFRIWIEKDGEFLMGKGGAEILKAIKKHGSISKASKELEMSYRYVWGYIKKMEEKLGKRIVETKRGGEKGGESSLTELAEKLLEVYEEAEKAFERKIEELRDSIKF
ncbi:putative transcriptional regulator, ModE family [Ferroglobus placidus DSM 10642]|uniref:Putative transcriptional regulator, ModE family n=1 Tax=Ferroglobus placidus (strain DSM 10642 / AEDII12DO) TaxID=589924 RepID=D3RZ80_FERPA|nr:winged helix-turn-helix domain-containing protein [Ferroglobus placidus]ADC65793.1 putative transcriptional regulator, ModE family [Ferroglobus placidus DSM 10642]